MSMVSSVVGGVDTHADVHVAAALDGNVGLLGVESFRVNGTGYRHLVEWLTSFGPSPVVRSSRCSGGSGRPLPMGSRWKRAVP